MINKIIKLSFLIHQLTKETKNPPSTFNNIYKNILTKKINKKRKKLLKLINKSTIKITKETYKRSLKNTKFTYNIKKLKKEVRKRMKSIFSKKEKYGKQMNIDHLIEEYKIKKLTNDWNTILFLIKVEDYVYDFIKKGGYVESVALNEEYKETQESFIWSEKTFFNFKTKNHPRKLKLKNELKIKNELKKEIHLENGFCLFCKKEISYKMIKNHLESKIHKKYSFVFILPNEEYFSYLASLFSFFTKKQKIKKDYFFHCELCCKEKACCKEKKDCLIKVNEEENHFKSDIHINNLNELGILVEKGNFLFQSNKAYAFINEEMEEMEDEEGNLYDKKTYYDLIKMGFL